MRKLHYAKRPNWFYIEYLLYVAHHRVVATKNMSLNPVIQLPIIHSLRALSPLDISLTPRSPKHHHQSPPMRRFSFFFLFFLCAT